jgi:acid phosphatase family membrane protein YuiD
VYWVVHNPTYPGYNRTNFIGGDKTVTLNYVQGTVKLSAYFEIPTGFTAPIANYTSPSGNSSIPLHLPQDSVILVAVVPVGSTGTGSFSASVIDQTIQTYQNDYNQTAALVPSGKIPSTYSSLVNSILAEAQALDKLGLPDQGTTLLNAIVPSAFPTPPNSSLQTDLLAGLAVAVVLVVLLAVMTLRSRGKSGYSVAIINDVQKDLAVLEVTAAKYDKAMADKLKSLRDKLSESS